jgi:hypothetical protein
MPIEPEIADQLMEMASHDIAETVRAAAALAEAAHTCAAAGNRDEVLHILLDIKPRLHEASQLLEVASFAGRNVKGKRRM